MAFCTSCGRRIEEGDGFCPSCGHPVTRDSGRPNQSEKYDGVVHKCPSCGQTVDAFEAKCPSCGYELRGVESSSRVNDLAAKLENINDIQRRNELIRNFYIPNTKEDIYEFFILATSNIDAGGEAPMLGMQSLIRHIKKQSSSLVVDLN